MDKSKVAAKFGNIYFLSRVGWSLREATRDIPREEIPPDIQHLLRRLDRLETLEKRQNGRAQGENGAD